MNDSETEEGAPDKNKKPRRTGGGGGQAVNMPQEGDCGATPSSSVSEARLKALLAAAKGAQQSRMDEVPDAQFSGNFDF